MRTSSRRTRRRRRAALTGAALLLAAALLGGCGGTTTSAQNADTAGGKELFTQKCGACHVLADAGTAGPTGPNLDDAFAASRREGFDESTFFEVTLEQMKIAAPPMPQFDDPSDEQNYLTHEELVSVAAYVAEVAGKPASADRTPQAAGDDPKAIFTASCGSCHTLADAGTSGTVGPNLDESSVSMEQAERQIAQGGGGMPAFRGQLSDEQIRRLAGYVVKARGGG